ncbi:hypothetical protein, partial [Escherichia coli]|uniref:hypothetical protein n=1 Tax=Escherichia coli TaxID=562 RepID=UPI003D33AFC6
GVSVITGVKQPEALDVIKRKALEGKSPIYHLGNEFTAGLRESIERGEIFTFLSMFGQIQNLRTTMIGSYQVDNAACAV